MKIGQYKTYPAFTVELESVVIKRMEKIRSKQNSNTTTMSGNTNVDISGNHNSHNSGCYFNSEENSADRQIRIETEKLERLCLD